jgi:hypothetical protein
MNNHDHHNPELPESLRDLERSLDALGKQARAEAPAALGDRIVAAGALAQAEAMSGRLRLAGTDAEPGFMHRFAGHWRLAASVSLLVVAVVAAIALHQPPANTGTVTGVDTIALTDDWVEFEIEYVADTSWNGEAFESLESDLDALELSLNEAWTLDENLSLNEGESL